ncbi:hypothetical protein Scep_002330 [Stephania cephalantha]|uniref:Uncharacterized protein n=1 Tax=Stephania cephalantha TaxID=152367 RepID=A0AAP0Q5V1_9MAGN
MEEECEVKVSARFDSNHVAEEDKLGTVGAGVGDGLKEIRSGSDRELRAERGDEVEGGDGLKEKEKEVTSLKEKEKEGWLDGRMRR